MEPHYRIAIIKIQNRRYNRQKKFLVPQGPVNMKKLILAEKPSLALKVVAGIGNMTKHDGYYENDDYIVTFAFGHLFVLSSVDEYMNREKTPWKLEELPFIPKKFIYKLQNDVRVKKQYNIIVNLYTRNDISSIINAGDPDREGSVIILNIINQLEIDTQKKYPVERIWLEATHPEYVREALKNLHPEEYYGNLYEEGLARTYTDWIYGINYTRYASLKSNTFLPVGRVLVPIVKYIYDRDQEISIFKPTTYYEIESVITKDGEEIKCKIEDSKFDNIDAANNLLSKLKSEKAYVESITSKEITKRPPKLFALDTLQNKLSKDLKYSSAQTLDIVQSLYEKGYVTYPRTNTEYMSESEVGLVEKILKTIPEINYIVNGDDKAIFDSSKVEGHSALIITTKKPNMTELSTDEKNVYLTIYNRFISNFLNEKTVVEKSSITIAIGESNKIILNGTQIKEEGFYKYEKKPEENYLPNFEKGEVINISKLDVVKKATQPPKHITEADLNMYLKNPFKSKEISENDDEDYKQLLAGCEIGTVATRAGIIQNALKYNYIKREKSYLCITEKGQYLIKVLLDLNINMEKQNTVEINQHLKKIYCKQEKTENLLQKVSEDVKKVIENGQNKEIERMEPKGICKCPKCNNGNILLAKSGKNYYCSNYKNNCDFTIWVSVADKKLTEQQVKTLITKGKTSTIKGFKSKKGEKFDAKLKLNSEMKIEFLFEK